MKNKTYLPVSLLATLALAACGGGGGGGGASATPAATAASAPSAASTPATTVNGVELPSLASPQAGSTAAVGNGIEGIWTSQSGVNKTTAFIDPQNNVSYVTSMSTVVMNEFFGAITTATPNWTLTSGDAYSLAFYYPTTSGSGTFASAQTFSGSFVSNGTTTSLSWTYDPANALAVTQGSVTGTWSESGSSLTVAADGSVSGTISNCPVTGTLLLATPSSSENLYTLSVTGTTTTCTLQSGKTYSGSAAITFLPISGSSLYTPTLMFIIRAPDNSAIAYGQLSQPK